MEQHRISTPQVAPSAHGARSKAPASTQPTAGLTAEDPAAAGGFLSLLSSLSDVATEDAWQPDAALLSQVAPQQDAALLPQFAPQQDAGLFLKLAQQPNAALSTGATQGSDTGFLAWQPQAGRFTRSDGVATLSLAEVAQQAGLLGAELLGQGGLVAQTARIDAASELSELPVVPGQGSAMAGYQRAFSRLQGVLSQGAAQGAAGSVQANGRGHVAIDKQGLTVPVGVSTVVATAPDRLEAVALASRISSEAAPPLLQAQWLGAAEPMTRLAAPLSSKELGAGADAWGGSAQGIHGESRAESEAVAVDAPTAGAEDSATEQASYWVSDNLQNAELTVTHDGMPVEVRVSLSGNEAHVEFGSDESQTRDLLDASQDQLRDMLRDEGLVLSGVSVGESGARNASGEGDTSARGRPSGRSTVQVPDGGAEARSRPSVLTDRAVDVFV